MGMLKAQSKTSRAVLFDLGGVLYHQGGCRIGKWEKRLGLEDGQLGEMIYTSPVGQQAVLGEVVPELVWKEVGRRLSLSPQDVVDLERDFWLDGKWDTRLLEFIRSLKPAIRIGLLSDAWLDARRRVEEAVGAGLFDVMVFSAEEGIRKPDSEIYLRALDRFGVEPVETMFVDDRLANVLGAREADLLAVQHLDRERTIRFINSWLRADRKDSSSSS